MTATLDTEPLVTFADRTLRRTPRDRTSIGTDRSDALYVTAPADATEASLKRAIGRHYDAIARWHQQETAIDAWQPIAKQLVGGEGFLLDGHGTRLKRDTDQPKGAAQFTRDGFGWWLNLHPDSDTAAAVRAIASCYAQQTRERVRQAAERIAPRFGYRHPLDIRTMSHDRAWISTRSAKGVLRVEAHWAVAQFSSPTVAYLVARALAARSDARVSLEAVMPVPHEPRRQFHREAPDVWTGKIAD